MSLWQHVKKHDGGGDGNDDDNDDDDDDDDNNNNNKHACLWSADTNNTRTIFLNSFFSGKCYKSVEKTIK